MSSSVHRLSATHGVTTHRNCLNATRSPHRAIGKSDENRSLAVPASPTNSSAGIHKIKNLQSTQMKFYSSSPAFLVVLFLFLSPLAAAVQPPARIVDAHHHYLDLGRNSFSSWLGGLFGNFAYLPEHYTADVVEPLAESNITLTGSVHIEVLTDTPFGGVEEAAWVQSLVDQGDAPELRAIVGSCDLGDANNVEECLSEMVDVSPLVRGIRWILDYVGPFDGSSATHVNAARKDIDYLRGGADGGVVPEFEEGYALLGEYGLSFDGQFAPEQAPAMATLASRYPNIPVIINHLGKPRLVLGPDSNATEPDQDIYFS